MAKATVAVPFIAVGIPATQAYDTFSDIARAVVWFSGSVVDVIAGEKPVDGVLAHDEILSSPRMGADRVHPHESPRMTR